MSERRRKRPGAIADPSPMGDVSYGIGDLADEFGITTRTIRFCEAKGLLSPPGRISGARTYGKRERARLMIILRAKNLGFSLEEIAEYLALYDADPTQITQLKHLIGKVDASVEELQKKRADLDRAMRELKDLRAKAVDALNDKKRQRKPLH